MTSFQLWLKRKIFLAQSGSDLTEVGNEDGHSSYLSICITAVTGNVMTFNLYTRQGGCVFESK